MKKIHQKSTFIHIGNKTKCIINYEVIDSKSKAILFKGKATGIAKLSPEDTYNNILGRRIAESRATIKMTDAIVIWANKIIKNNNENLSSFQNLLINLALWLVLNLTDLKKFHFIIFKIKN